MWGTARRLETYCNKVRVQINHITYKTKESCKHLIYSSLILIYCIFSDLYFTSSKSTLSQYEQLAYTCCNYIANPKISIHKQHTLLFTKVRFLFINNEMQTHKNQKKAMFLTDSSVLSLPLCMILGCYTQTTIRKRCRYITNSSCKTIYYIEICQYGANS